MCIQIEERSIDGSVVRDSPSALEQNTLSSVLSTFSTKTFRYEKLTLVWDVKQASLLLKEQNERNVLDPCLTLKAPRKKCI